MRLFYYVHTGHRIGLDRFRRAAAIIKSLGDADITLLTSDYRIASVARDYGIKRAVGVDVVRNIPQIAHHGDKIIFDSAEFSPGLLNEMTRFFSTFIRVSDDPEDQKYPGELLISPYFEGEGVCNAVAVDPVFKTPCEKTIPRAFFFGDDDYEEDLANNIACFEGLECELLLGFYYFFGYEQKLQSAFVKQHESETYEEVIRATDILITASPQAALENLLSGGRPVFLQRADYPRDFLPLFKQLKIPVVEGFNKENLFNTIQNIDSHIYHELKQNSENLIDFLRKNLNL